MSVSEQSIAAIRELGRQLTALILPEQTEQVIALVVQQQRLLEAYVQATPAGVVDVGLIREVSVKNSQLMQRATIAHTHAAAELDALALQRTAVSAYADGVSEPIGA